MVWCGDVIFFLLFFWDGLVFRRYGVLGWWRFRDAAAPWCVLVWFVGWLLGSSAEVRQFCARTRKFQLGFLRPGHENPGRWRVRTGQA